MGYQIRFPAKCACIELNSENESKSWKSFERMNIKQCQLFFSNDNLNLTLAIKIENLFPGVHQAF